MADNEDLKGLIRVTVTIDASPTLFERGEARKGDGSEDKVVYPSLLEQLLVALLQGVSIRSKPGPPHRGREYDVAPGIGSRSTPDQSTGEVRGQ